MEYPGQKGDPEEYLRAILPGLQGVTLPRIMEACGVAKSTASMIRSGREYLLRGTGRPSGASGRNKARKSTLQS
jgi:hypothetical protein